MSLVFKALTFLSIKNSLIIVFFSIDYFSKNYCSKSKVVMVRNRHFDFSLLKRKW